jgi:hypothetical protein
MKIIIMLLMTFSSFTCFASLDGKLLKQKKLEELSIILYKNKLAVASAIMSKSHLKNKKIATGSFSTITENILRESGPIAFSDLSVKALKKYNNESFNFLIGTKLYERKKFKESLKYFKKVKLAHRYYAEKLVYEGSALLELNKVEDAKETFFNCAVIADDMARDESNQKVINYLNIIKDRCHVNLARVHFEKYDFKKAIQTYNKVSKQSFLWPYTLMEKAWAYYQLENHNRTLGLLVTYKSPLLSSYFFPETELLTALSYNKLCLWDDSLAIINNYHNKFKAQSDVIKKILESNKKSSTYFYNLYNSKTNDLYKYSFIKNIKTHLSKKIRLNLNLLFIEKIMKEEKRITELDFSKELRKKLITQYKKYLTMAKVNLNNIIKAYLFNYVNNIHKLSYEMFNINLDIVSNRRNLLYTNKGLVSKRARGSFSNIKRENNEYFYSFDGPFWADELGDYSFGLKSNCLNVKNKVVSK